MIDLYYVDLARNSLSETIANLVTTQNYLRDAGLENTQAHIDVILEELNELQKRLGRIKKHGE